MTLCMSRRCPICGLVFYLEAYNPINDPSTRLADRKVFCTICGWGGKYTDAAEINSMQDKEYVVKFGKNGKHCGTYGPYKTIDDAVVAHIEDDLTGKIFERIVIDTEVDLGEYKKKLEGDRERALCLLSILDKIEGYEFP